jgi:hypothetical protein
MWARRNRSSDGGHGRRCRAPRWSVLADRGGVCGAQRCGCQVGSGTRSVRGRGDPRPGRNTPGHSSSPHRSGTQSTPKRHARPRRRRSTSGDTHDAIRARPSTPRTPPPTRSTLPPGPPRNRNLRSTADCYDRAARAPFGRMPRHTRDGDRLRAVARVLALTGGMDDDNLPLAALALIANLVGLAAAVAELRQAQRHAAQAVAAHAAAEQLHAAHIQLRARVPSFGRTEAQRPARPRDATSRVSREFPLSPLVGLRESTQPGLVDAEAANPSPQRATGQSARASPRR